MPNTSLAELTWFRVGGPAEALFMPADEADLAAFLAGAPSDVPVTVVGVGSNLLVRDGGVRGVVVRLGRGFTDIRIEPGHRVRAGAGALDVAVARAAADAGLAGLEFLRGIPGTIGGGLRMNAGAYGGEFKDVLIAARALDRQGTEPHAVLRGDGFPLSRQCGFRAISSLSKPCSKAIPVMRKRSPSAWPRSRRRARTRSPSRSRTGGSTFKNPVPASTTVKNPVPESDGLCQEHGWQTPDGKRAWELIEAAGCRGLTVGDAQVSEKHCNFLINRGAAKRGRLGSAWRGSAQARARKDGRCPRMGNQAYRRGRVMAFDPRTTHVAVLKGGWSAERDVSLVSGAACGKALREEGFRVSELDAGRDVAEKLAALKPDVVFNALHGQGGEDGCIQGVLEILELPYTHSGVLASALAMDKERAKHAFRAANLPCARDVVLDRREAARKPCHGAALCAEAGGARLERRRVHRAQGRQPAARCAHPSRLAARRPHHGGGIHSRAAS